MSRIRGRTLGTNKRTLIRPGLSNLSVSNRTRCSTRGTLRRLKISSSNGVKIRTNISNRIVGTTKIMSITKLRTPGGARHLRMTGTSKETHSTPGTLTLKSLNLKTIGTSRQTHSIAGTLTLRMSPSIMSRSRITTNRARKSSNGNLRDPTQWRL